MLECLLCYLLSILGKRVSAFDVVKRTGFEPADHLISRFDYLNASARPEAARVRAAVDSFLCRYPKSHRPGIIRRLRSRDDALHGSAFFELFLHELLIRRCFKIVAIEPALPNGRAPDFLVAAPDGSRFYLEATLASGLDDVGAGADRRMREALQAIDDVKSPDFFLHLHTRGVPAKPVAVKRLRRAVQEFVDGLDYEAGRAIGGQVLPGGIVMPHVAIKSEIERKAGRYGKLGLPFIIAVNALEEFAGIKDAVDALFGRVTISAPEGGAPQQRRLPEGVWRGANGPVYTRVSGVLFVNRLSPWDLGQRSVHLILNPWARRPLPDIPIGIETRHIVDDRLVVKEGLALREIFELAEDWPE